MNFNEGDPCPCGSRRDVAKCCIRQGRWRLKEPHRDVIKRTGIGNPDCYMGATNDCSQDMSREHAISASVLRVIAPDNDLTISGFAWQPRDPMPVGINSLASHVLCERHNSFHLSPLDVVAGKVFSRIRDIAAEFNGAQPDGPDAILVSGHAFERWVLKTLCGLAVSGSTSHRGERLRGWEMPDRWLPLVLGDAPFSPPWGLYSASDLGDTFSSKPSFAFATIGIQANPHDLVGASIAVSGFRFLLAVERLAPADPFKADGYRLSSMRFTDGQREKFILFAWPRDAAARTREVTVNWRPPDAPTGAAER